jgi:hypothetical protein
MHDCSLGLKQSGFRTSAEWEVVWQRVTLRHWHDLPSSDGVVDSIRI